MLPANAHKTEARRKEILAAALTCFKKKGFLATKMVDIAAAVPMSVGNLYNYFKNKDAIVERFATQEIDSLEQKLKEGEWHHADVIQYTKEIQVFALQRLSAISARLMLEMFFEATRNENIANTLYSFDRKWREVVLEAYLSKGISKEKALESIEVDLCVFGGLTLRALAHENFSDKEKERLATNVAKLIIEKKLAE